MLKLTDLSVNKELDRSAMAGVTGGTSMEKLVPVLDLSTSFDLTAVNQPSIAAATTGSQLIGQGLYDNDVASAGHGGIGFNYSHNSQSAHNTAIPTAISAPIVVKG